MSWCYSGLVGHIGAEHPIYGLQTRGLLEPQRLPGSVEEIAEDYLRGMRSVQPHGPYQLLGWSFGGLVAHAIATRLRGEGQEVALLALMDSYPVTGPTADRAAAWPDVLAVLLGEAAITAAELADLPARPAPDELAQFVHQHNPVLAALEAAEIAGLADAVSVHINTMRRFEPAEFHGDLVFFNAARGRTEGTSTVDLWRPYIKGRIKVHDIDSAHLEMANPDPLAEIGGILSAILNTNQLVDRFRERRS